MSNLYISLCLVVVDILKGICIGWINDQEKEHILSSVKWVSLPSFRACRNDVFGLFFSMMYLNGALSVAAIVPVTVWIFLSFFAYMIDARLRTVGLLPCRDVV